MQRPSQPQRVKAPTSMSVQAATSHPGARPPEPTPSLDCSRSRGFLVSSPDPARAAPERYDGAVISTASAAELDSSRTASPSVSCGGVDRWAEEFQSIRARGSCRRPSKPRRAGFDFPRMLHFDGEQKADLQAARKGTSTSLLRGSRPDSAPGSAGIRHQSPPLGRVHHA